LQACPVNESNRNRAVVLVHNHIDRSKVTKRIRLRGKDLVGDDAIPNRIEGRGRKDIIARIGCQVEVIKGKFAWLPEEIEDTRTDASSDLAMGVGSSFVGCAVKICKEQSGLVYLFKIPISHNVS